MAETSSLSLPQNLAKFLPTGQDIRMAFTFYREPNLFPVREMQMDVDQSIVGNPVIGATVSAWSSERLIHRYTSNTGTHTCTNTCGR